MSGPSKIEWTERTWNPVRGCTRVSEGCRHCYAEGIAARFSGPQQPYEGIAEMRDGKPRWTGKLAFAEGALLEPLKRRKPTTYFVNSMSDLFHEKMPDAWIDRVFAVMALCPQHTFQVLTKRPARMRAWFRTNSTGGWIFHVASEVDPKGFGAKSGRWPLPNVWLGTSCEDQATADARVPELLATTAAVRFVSAEPLLGPIDFRFLQPGDPPVEIDALAGTHGVLRPHGGENARLSWVIVGGESGPGARPMHPAWARSIRDQCAAAGTAFLFKQWGAWSDTHPNWRHATPMAMANDGTLYALADIAYPDGPRYGEALRANHDKAHLTSMYRLGKARAGRLLDGVEHKGTPQVRA